MAVGSKNARQFTDLFGEVIPFKATADFASAAAGAAASVDIAVAGAELGDLVLIAPALDTADAILSAQVTAADVVTATVVANSTSGTEDFASQTLTGVVLKPGGAFQAL